MGLGDLPVGCDAAVPVQGPVTTSDIATVHLEDPSEVRANIQNRPDVMVHNYTYRKVVDATALEFVHVCQFQFRLPHLPATSNRDKNGQTIEGMLTLWDGAVSRSIYTMGFQWIVSPYWMTGALQQWTATAWVPGGTIPLSTNWHAVRMVLDRYRRQTELQVDGKTYSSMFVVQSGPASWGSEVAAWISAEAISIDPGPGLNGGMRHAAEVRDWAWFWEPAGFRLFLPSIPRVA